MNLSSKLVSKIVLLALISISLLVTPLNSFDPINIPRFCLLIIFTLVILFVLFFNGLIRIIKNIWVYFLISALFLAWMVLSTLMSDLTFMEGLLGTSGRYTGVLTYFGLNILMLASILCSEKWFNKNLIRVLVIIGIINTMYAFFQNLGLDFFEWVNPYSPIIGLYGNPNFLSAFLGMVGVLLLNYNLNFKPQLKITTMLIFGQITILYVIQSSKSVQGILVYLIGALVLIFIKIRNTYKRKFLIIFISISFMFILILLADVFQKVPWNPLLYKESVSFRGDFWRAGINMVRDNLWFGVGPDGYRNNYRLYRDQTAVNRNSNVPVDSAHNMFIDLASSGGIILLILYCVMIGLTIRSIILILKQHNLQDSYITGITAVWIAYLSQSIISVGQISILIWGWVLSGAIIGYEKKYITRKKPDNSDIFFKKKLVPIFSGITLGILLSYPVFMQDKNFREVLNKGQVEMIIEQVNSWPQQVTHRNTASLILRKAGFNKDALSVARGSVKSFPNNYEAWREIYLNPNISEREKIAILNKLKSLDPLNKNHN